MTKNKPFNEAFNAVMTALIVLPLLVTIEKLLLPDAAPWMGVLSLVTTFVCYPVGRLLRKKDRQTALTAGIVVSAFTPVLALIFFTASINVFSKVALYLLTVVSAMIAFLIPLIHGGSLPNGKWFIAGIGAYVIAIVVGGENAASYSLTLNICSVALLITTLFVFNIKGLADATSPGQHRVRFPKGMRQSNMLILAFFVILALALANIQAIKDAAIRLGVAIVDGLLSFLQFMANINGAPSSAGEAQGGGGDVGMGLIADAAVQSPLSKLLWKILLYVIIAAAIILVCFFLYKLIRHLISKFGGLLGRFVNATLTDEDYIDETEDLEDAGEEKRRRKRGAKREKRARYGDMPSPRAKVRFAMREYLRRNPYAQRSKTPSELSYEFDRIMPGYGDDFGRLYSRARYAEDDVSEEEASLARRLLDKM